MVYMIESQLAYVLDALRSMEEAGTEVVELRPETESAYNASLDRKLAGTVWNTGCSSWYFDAGGRNAALWPDWTWRFRRRTARFDAGSYLARPGVAATSAAA